jgi:hypothetical protein
MNRLIALLLAAVPFLFACSSNAPYRPASFPEKAELKRARTIAYPEDIRQDLDSYTNTGVAWAGIILSTQAKPGPDGLIHATTIFEHHYFNWTEGRGFRSLHLSVSPRGEGLFRADWVLRRTDPAAGSPAAESFARPGKLAIVYGVPQEVEDGTVVLRYRFLRVFDADQFNTNQLDYGRARQPFQSTVNPPVQPTP